MSKRRENFITWLKKYKNDSTEVICTALSGFLGDLITELDEKDKQIELLEDHIITLKQSLAYSKHCGA